MERTDTAAWAPVLAVNAVLAGPVAAYVQASATIPPAKRKGRGHAQSDRLMTMLCGPKWLAMSHDVLGKSAMGVPQLAVLTVVAPLATSLGMLLACRCQNQTLTPLLARCPE